MRSTTAFTLIALMVRFSVGASGQEAKPQQPSVPSTAPARSFDELRATLRVGDNLIVRDVTGHTTRGRLVALTGTAMEIETARSWFRHGQRTFTEAEIRRVKIRDSGWNGALIGLGLGGAASWIGCRAESRADPTGGDYGCLKYVIFVPWLAFSIGGVVDSLINRTVYQASGKTTLTLSPVVAARRIGMAARVQF